ncbi:hypothetical protein MAPG_05081 [Magnaporthiopsis poae ATCC 64411]|uniref:Uncharacterized protein n=1 Tax=Magnaporthiopsis poae (strain ATCC 64411 / 73-15) TaxID=644358 RepID=A0A0C4DYG0_MAGP6|nr:hypothetical protein MAPG_05081 [Magnaporthiopsis poae ATCC 64411]
MSCVVAHAMGSIKWTAPTSPSPYRIPPSASPRTQGSQLSTLFFPSLIRPNRSLSDLPTEKKRKEKRKPHHQQPKMRFFHLAVTLAAAGLAAASPVPEGETTAKCPSWMRSGRLLEGNACCVYDFNIGHCCNLTNDPRLYQVPSCSSESFSSRDGFSRYRVCNEGRQSGEACDGVPTVDKQWKWPEQKQ